MARQQGDAAEYALVEKIGLLGDKTNRVRIDQLRVDQGIEIDAQKGRIDERTFDRLDAEKHILPGDIAEAVLHFASERRSGKSTGNILNVDGGVPAAYSR